MRAGMLTAALALRGRREEGGTGKGVSRPAVLFLQEAPLRVRCGSRRGTPGALPGVSSGRDMGFS